MANKKLTQLAEIKIKLAKKYEHLANLAGSQPKRTKFRRTASYFRHQAKMLQIKASQ